MEIDTIDLVFWGFITLVVIGGLVCLIIFLPREHDYEDKYANCYRILYRDGGYSITRRKPVYGENTFSLRGKYFYIHRAPFQLTAVCDGADAPDGKSYRAAAAVTVCFPEDKLQVFAPTFHGVTHDAIIETLEEALGAAMQEAVGQYDSTAGAEAFTELFKAAAKEKLEIFGVYVMHVGEARISCNGNAGPAMEQMTGMEDIGHRQKQLCEFLIRMMPVDWCRIYFYAQVIDGSISVWFAGEEKLTGAVCTIFDFWKRYDSYPISKDVAGNDLPIYASLLYNAYRTRFGEEKLWKTYYLTINDDYTFHADLGYDTPPSDIIESFKAVYRKFFNTEHRSVVKKYPY